MTKKTRISKESANVCFDRVHPKGWTVSWLVAWVHAWRSFLCKRDPSPETFHLWRLRRQNLWDFSATRTGCDKWRTCFLVMDPGSCDLGRAIIASPPPHSVHSSFSSSCERTIPERRGLPTSPLLKNHPIRHQVAQKRNWLEIRVRHRRVHEASLSNRTRNTSKCSITRVCHRAAGHERWSELSEKSLPTKKTYMHLAWVFMWE